MSSNTQSNIEDWTLLSRKKSERIGGYMTKWDIVIQPTNNPALILETLANGNMAEYVYQVMYKIEGINHSFQIGDFDEEIQKQQKGEKAIQVLKHLSTYLTLNE